jgi:pectate lyase
MIGFATMSSDGLNGTTGGAGGPTVTVTTFAELQKAVKDLGTMIIKFSGTITGPGIASFSGNKTLIGEGPNATLNQIMLSIDSDDNGGANVIVKNITINKSPNDGIGVFERGHHVWIDHCTIIDAADGAIDITKGAAYVTVSWCKFIYPGKGTHALANLIGASDGDNHPFYVTFHHCWWSDNTIERMPSVRFGRVHVFNCYFNTPGNNYCVRTRIGAEVLVENNYFENVKNPWERYVTAAGGVPGKLKATGNIEVNTTWYVNPAPDIGGNQSFLIPGDDTIFAPPYAYTLESAANVKASVMTGVGPR